jgi:hypothetical protein
MQVVDITRGDIYTIRCSKYPNIWLLLEILDISGNFVKAYEHKSRFTIHCSVDNFNSDYVVKKANRTEILLYRKSIDVVEILKEFPIQDQPGY